MFCRLKKWLVDSRSCFIDKKMSVFLPNASPRGGSRSILGLCAPRMGRVCAPYVSSGCPMCGPAGDVRDIRARTSRDLELGVGWNS